MTISREGIEGAWTTVGGKSVAETVGRARIAIERMRT